MLGKQSSEHYIFHYHLNSKAEKDINKIIDIQERGFNYLSHLLDIEFQEKIEYYLCNSKDEVGEFYGDNKPCSAFARKPNKVYSVYNDDLQCIGFHEDAHLFSYQINTPKSAAFREGLAMFFDKKWWKIPNIEWVQYYLKSHQYCSIEELSKDDLFYQVDCAISYPIMGYFTEYLILTYGISKYIEFYSYKEDDLIHHFKHCYNKSIHELEKQFISHVNLFECDPIIEKRIQTPLKND